MDLIVAPRNLAPAYFSELFGVHSPYALDSGVLLCIYWCARFNKVLRCYLHSQYLFVDMRNDLPNI
jgi:hypothetical protein